MTPVKQSMVRVIRPGYKPVVKGRPNPITLADYVIVPRLSIRGRYKIADLLQPDQLARLAIFTNKMEKELA